MKAKYITRHEKPNSKNTGYQVRIVYLFHNINITKFFTDSIYGGKKQAFQAAVVYRNKIVAKLKRKNIKRVYCRYHQKNDKKNSVCPGVHFFYQRGIKYWGAVYNFPRYRCNSKRFSVRIWGEARAKSLAMAYRQKGLRLVKAQLEQERSVKK